MLFIISLCSCTIAQTIEDGLKLFENEKFDAAKQFFQTYLDKNKTAESFFFNGKILLKTKNVEEALKSFQEGIRQFPKASINYGGLAVYYLVKNDSNEANKQLEETLDRIEKKSNTTLVEVASLIIECAIEPYYYKAIELLNKAITIDRKNYKIYMAFADMYYSQNNGTLAIENYKKATDYNFKCVMGYVGIGKVYARIKNNAGAELSFKEAITYDSTYAIPYKELAELYYSQRKYEKAIENYKKYLDNSDKTGNNLARYATFLYLNKNYNESSAIIDEVLGKDPNNQKMIQLKAYALHEANDFINGVPTYEKYFSLVKPEEVASTDYEYFADLLLKAGKDSIAALNYSKAANMDSTKYELFGNVAAIYFKLKNFPEAINNYELKTAKTGKELAIRENFDLGQAYFYIKEYQKADLTFKKVTAAKPDFVYAHLWLAFTNASIDTTSELGLAKPHYEKFIEFASPTPDKFKSNLIQAYSYLGYYYFLKKEDPAYKDIYKAEYQKNWEKVLALDPENVQAKEALKNLKLLK
jgi:tetratricopeptide (TPR) repeat protein